MRAVNTLRIAKRNVFFGPGPRLLLERIDQLSSLRQATIDTGISYTKALRVLRKIESELGFAVVESARGGSQRGGTNLTPQGKKLLQVYGEMEKELDEYAQKLVAQKLAFLEEGQEG